MAAWLAATAMVPNRDTSRHSTPKKLVSRKMASPMGMPIRKCSRTWEKEKPEIRNTWKSRNTFSRSTSREKERHSSQQVMAVPTPAPGPPRAGAPSLPKMKM